MAAQDVSARRAAEEKVAEHDAYIHALTENNPLAIVVLNANHRVQLCNPAFETLFGYQQSEIVGTEIDLLLAPAREASEALDLTKRAMNGEVVRLEAKRRRNDGSMVDVQIVGVPLIANGKQIGCFGMYEDITERRRAEDAQHRAEERLRMLFENAVEGIFQTTPQGRILSLNPALARMCGYASCAEMMREVKNVDQELYVDRDLREEFKRRIEQQGVVEQFEYQLRRKDGARIWVSENARAIRNSRGKIACYEGTVEDITSKKRAELERQVNFEIIHAVNATDNLDDLLKLIHIALKRVLYAENCFVALYEPSTQMFHFPFFADQYDVAPPPQQVGRSCTAYVFHKEHAMLIPQKAFDKLAAQGRSGTGWHAISLMAGRAASNAGGDDRRSGSSALRRRECIHRARFGISGLGWRPDRHGHRAKTLGRKNTRKRSTPARIGSAIARRALDCRARSSIHFGAGSGTDAPGTKTKPDRWDVATGIF